MDYSTIESKLSTYFSIEQFDDDVQLIFSNCIEYNGNQSSWVKFAQRLRSLWKRKLPEFQSRLERQFLGEDEDDDGLRKVIFF